MKEQNKFYVSGKTGKVISILGNNINYCYGNYILVPASLSNILSALSNLILTTTLWNTNDFSQHTDKKILERKKYFPYFHRVKKMKKI